MSEGRSDPKLVPWVLVATGFHRNGGMEKANAALAGYLLGEGHPVHLVGHSIAPELAEHENVRVHLVRSPVPSAELAERLLERVGRSTAWRVTRADSGARVLVNGGNCDWADLNWVHAVHRAWPASDASAPTWFRWKNRIARASARRREAAIVPRARVVVANSDQTRRHLIDLLGCEPARVRTVYLGAEEGWGVPSAEERHRARNRLGISDERPIVAFVGALGHDTGKGIDTLLEAWRIACSDPSWDADLIVAGAGRGLERWRAWADARLPPGRARFLGFTPDIAALLAATDLLVSPTRYDAYGLNVQEAISRGVPALVTANAGVSERYPPDLGQMILPDPDDAQELARRLLAWRPRAAEWRVRFQPLGERFRAHGWRDMAREIAAL